MANQRVEGEREIQDRVEDNFSSGDIPLYYREPRRRFDEEGEGYDEIRGEELNSLYPLNIPAPDRAGQYDRETISGEEESFSAWVWHEEESTWKKHGGSLDPRTGMVLKGMRHPTWGLMHEEEKRLGNKIVWREEEGRFFSEKTPKRKDFDYIISNAPKELAQVYSKQDGRTHHALYTMEDDDGERRYVYGTADEWWRDKRLSVNDVLYKSANTNWSNENFIDGYSYYDDMTKKGFFEKVMDRITR